MESNSPTPTHEQIASLFDMLSSRQRLELLFCLMEKDQQNVSELLNQVKVKPTTLSNHLGKLTKAGIIKFERKHRHRHYSLTHPKVRAILESFEWRT